MSTSTPPSLLPVRSALVLLLALLSGLAVAVLTYASTPDLIPAALAGLVATGAAAVAWNQLIA